MSVVHHLDGGDLGCARLLVLLRARVAELADGDVVHLSTSDPVAPIDLPVWCRMTGHEYLGPVADAAPCPDRGSVTYGVRVCGQARATQEGSPWHLAQD